jgi:hypothetical protein
VLVELERPQVLRPNRHVAEDADRDRGLSFHERANSGTRLPLYFGPQAARKFKQPPQIIGIIELAERCLVLVCKARQSAGTFPASLLSSSSTEVSTLTQRRAISTSVLARSRLNYVSATDHFDRRRKMRLQFSIVTRSLRDPDGLRRGSALDQRCQGRVLYGSAGVGRSGVPARERHRLRHRCRCQR